MPELPEVQTIVNDLNKKVVGRKIIGAWLDWPKMVKGKIRAAGFERAIRGSKILKVQRRAKNILIYLRNPRFDQRESANLLLLIHQKMTGHMLVGKFKIQNPKSKSIVIPLAPKAVAEDPYNKYIHLILYLDNGKMLALSDLRKFAKVILGKREEIENLPELTNLGPDALDIQYGQFADTISREGRKIKQVLMDQEVIAGIGNIYSDDILWDAKIHPLKPSNKLSGKELRALWNSMRKILTLALKLRGTSISDYRDTAGEKGYYAEKRKAYQREGEPCPRCGAKIKRVKLGGRSAHFCPKCQILTPTP